MEIHNAKIDGYFANCTERHRPPSRGGNSGSLHQHVLVIDGQRYSFVTVGWKRAIHKGKGETVSFEWDWDKSGRYRNIDTSTMRVYDKDGRRVKRG